MSPSFRVKDYVGYKDIIPFIQYSQFSFYKDSQIKIEQVINKFCSTIR